VTDLEQPALSIVIPTFNNLPALSECLDSWQRYAAAQPVEIIVIEDGCRDSTPAYLETAARSPWGQRHLRWHHQDDQHELRCTNFGFRQARAPLMAAWQDDMFLRSTWLVPELIATFLTYPDVGLLCLSRGLDCVHDETPIASWDDLIDWRRLQSTIGSRPLNWIRLQEVDAVIRPWVVRRTCIETVGLLDEAFVPTEWDEADLSFRIRRAGWKVATHGYERLGAYYHLGSTTVGPTLSDKHKEHVLRNGRLFHERWDDAIRRESRRTRKTWWRRTDAAGWWWTARAALRTLLAADRSSPTS
jgi:GT2 family glycosyltransferase